MGLLACLIFVPGAYSIDVGFSAENGGESVDLSSSYDVDTGVSVNEESEASFDQVKIENTRSVSGTGDISAAQTYSGSGGYKGSAILSAQGASGTLHGNAFLTPEYLSAKQDISLTGDSIDTGMSLSNEGDSANLGVTIKSGMISSSQSIETGSVNNQILANIEAQLILYRQLVNILGNEVNSLTKINTPTSSPVVLNGAANSYTGNRLDFAVSSDANNINVDDNQRVIDSDGSEVNVITQVTNAKSCDYKYLPNSIRPPFYDSIYYHDDRVTLTAKDADKISAYASVGKNSIGSGGQYANGGSEVKLDVIHGSVDGYSNKAYFDGTNFIASQRANSVSGSSSPYSTSVTFQQMAYYPDGESNQILPGATNSLDVTGYSNVEGFSSTATSGPTNSYVNQNVDFASGTWVFTSQDGINKEGDKVQGSLWNQGGSNKGTVNGYSSTVRVTKNNAYSSQDIGSTSGNIINVGSSASDIQNGKPIIESHVSTYIENNAAIIGYSSSATAEKQALTNTYSVTSRQNANIASGNRVIISGESWKNNYVDESNSPVSHIVDGLASSGLEAYGGYVNGYWNEGSAKKMDYAAPFDNIFSLTSFLKLNNAWGDTISTGTSAFNNLPGIRAGNLDLIKANVYTKVTGGGISTYSDSSNVGVNSADASANINANGASIDVKSEVANAKPNDEFLSAHVEDYVIPYLSGTFYDKKTKSVIAKGTTFTGDFEYVEKATQGRGEFEFKTYDSLSATVKSNADSNGVQISPSNILVTHGFNQFEPKNAIILEPMFTAFDTSFNMNSEWNVADWGEGVFPALVNNGYATTRYTDSAASKDKFLELYDYNVALISSHMNNENIALSYGNDVNYKELKYTDPKPDSLIILAGCGSFEPMHWYDYFSNYWSLDSALQKAVSKATLSGGYEKSVKTDWNQDYIAEIFKNMDEKGMTFGEAESDVWLHYAPGWVVSHNIDMSKPFIDQGVLGLTMYGDTNFRLVSLPNV